MNQEQQIQLNMVDQQITQNHKTNHILHLLLCLPTGGLWIIIWIIVAINNAIEASRERKRFRKQLITED